MLISAVRCPISRSRTRCTAAIAWSASLLIGANRPRPAHRLADRFGIGRVRLVTIHIGRSVRRRDQPHLMAEPMQQAPPMMRRGARLQADQTARQFGEKPHHLAPPQLPPQYHHAGRIHPMHLKNLLGDVQTDCRNLLPLVGAKSQHDTAMPCGGHPPHQGRARRHQIAACRREVAVSRGSRHSSTRRNGTCHNEEKEGDAAC
jgi:hypothetical protein